jgi:hypothetical protein
MAGFVLTNRPTSDPVGTVRTAVTGSSGQILPPATGPQMVQNRLYRAVSPKVTQSPLMASGRAYTSNGRAWKGKPPEVRDDRSVGKGEGPSSPSRGSNPAFPHFIPIDRGRRARGILEVRGNVDRESRP